MKKSRNQFWLLLVLLAAVPVFISCDQVLPEPTATILPSPTVTCTPDPEIFTSKGNKLLKESDLEEAQMAYQNALEVDPDYIPALIGLSEAAYWEGDAQNALDLAETAYELDSDNVGVYLALARAQLIGETESEALYTAQEGLENFNLHPDLLALLGQAYLADHQYENAEEVIRKAYQIAPESSEVLYSLAQYLIATAEFDLAEAALLKAAEQEPDFFAWEVYLGNHHLKRKRYQQAAAAYENARKLAPDQAYPLVGLAELHRTKKEYDQAFSMLEEARENGLEERNYRVKRAANFVNQEMYLEAVEELDEVLQEAPEDYETKIELAEIYLVQDECDQAQSLFSELERERPRDLQVVLGRGFAELCAEKPRRSLDHFLRAADLDPYSYASEQGKGKAYLAQGRYEDAKWAFLNALMLSPSPASLHADLGIWAFRQGFVEDSERELQIARELDAYNIDIFPMLAEVYLLREETQKAIEIVDQGMGLDGDYIPLLIASALAHYFDGQPEQAIKILEDQIGDYSQYPDAYLIHGLAYRDLDKYYDAKLKIDAYLKVNQENLIESEVFRLEILSHWLKNGYVMLKNRAVKTMEDFFSYWEIPVTSIEVNDLNDQGRTVVFELPVTRAEIESGKAYEKLVGAAMVSSYVVPLIEPPADNGVVINLQINGRTELSGTFSLEILRKYLDTIIDEDMFLMEMGLADSSLVYQPKSFAQIRQEVGRIREFNQLDQVFLESLSEEEFKTYFQEALPEDFLEVIELQDVLLTMLGLIPGDLDLAGSYQNTYSTEVNGFYEAGENKLFIIEKEDASFFDEVTIAHEYVHAYQDQTYDLEDIQNQSFSSDQSIAIKALLEGDATLASMHYLSENITLEDELESMSEEITGLGDDFQDAPRYFQELVLFPYLEGLNFVDALYQRGGWELVNQAYQDLPKSTEQILHPSSYWEGDYPILVEMDQEVSAISEDWKLIENDVIGEFTLRMILAENLGPTAAGVGAEGWGGDSYLLYHQPEKDQYAVVLKTVWDDQDEAEEFYHFFRKSYSHRPGCKPVIDEITIDANEAQWQLESEFISLSLEGDYVMLIVSETKEFHDRLLDHQD